MSKLSRKNYISYYGVKLGKERSESYLYVLSVGILLNNGTLYSSLFCVLLSRLSGLVVGLKK